MLYWTLTPVWLLDFIGSAVMIIVTAQCLFMARRFLKKDPESPIANYLYWFTGAIFAFSASRSLGHIIKHLLYFTGHFDAWKNLAPISGSINSIAFVVIASVTLFFNRMQTIMERMIRDRERIEKTSHEIYDLNKNIESIVSERTKEEMSLRISHEVRNPVMIIGGLVRRLLSKAPQECMQEKEHLQQIVSEAHKLESLVNTFEQKKPAEEKKIVPLELNELIEELLDIIQQEADQKDIAILLDRSQVNLNFQGNKQLLKNALMHIIRNSIEACKKGDTISISSEYSERGIVLKIDDNGPGIPPKILHHIYEPFFVTDEGETGIGIPFVKQIIIEHKGLINITSKVNKGTTVEVILPTHLGELQKDELSFQI